jgi:hypothetical protein
VNSPPPESVAGAGSSEAPEALGANSDAPSGAEAGIELAPLVSIVGLEGRGVGRGRGLGDGVGVDTARGVEIGLAVDAGVTDGAEDCRALLRFSACGVAGFDACSMTLATPAQSPAVTAVTVHTIETVLSNPATLPPVRRAQRPAPAAAVPAPAVASGPDRSQMLPTRDDQRSKNPAVGARGRISRAR